MKEKKSEKGGVVEIKLAIKILYITILFYKRVFTNLRYV